MDFFYTKIENREPVAARIGIKGHAPLSQFLNSSFILQLRYALFLNFFLKNPCNYLKSIVYYTSATKQRFHSQVGKAEDCNSSTIGSSPVGTSTYVPWWRNW